LVDGVLLQMLKFVRLRGGEDLTLGFVLDAVDDEGGGGGGVVGFVKLVRAAVAGWHCYEEGMRFNCRAPMYVLFIRSGWV